MAAFTIRCKIENISSRSESAEIPRMLVDTGSECTWVTAKTLEKLDVEREKKDISFIMAKGQVVTRRVEFAIVGYDKFFTVDKVVFAERRDLLLLGARTLDGSQPGAGPAEKGTRCNRPV